MMTLPASAELQLESNWSQGRKVLVLPVSDPAMGIELASPIHKSCDLTALPPPPFCFRELSCEVSTLDMGVAAGVLHLNRCGHHPRRAGRQSRHSPFARFSYSPSGSGYKILLNHHASGPYNPPTVTSPQ